MFRLVHGLDFKKGGLVTQRHNEVRDALGDIAALACKMTRELVVREADEERGVSAPIADLGVRGVWQPQIEALFDIGVIDTLTPSFSCSLLCECCAWYRGERDEIKICSSSTDSPCIFFPFFVVWIG